METIWTPAFLTLFSDVSDRPQECPKCGSVTVMVPTLVPHKSEWLVYSGLMLRTPEHLRWECRCGYAIVSTTKDAPTGTPTSVPSANEPTL